MTAGAGKTTQLIQDVLDLLKQGVNLREILILSFSRATVTEVKERLRAKMTYLSDPDWSVASHNIRTQHSLCWGGMRSDFELMSGDQVNLFSKAYGYRISSKYANPNPDDFYNSMFSDTGFIQSDDDKAFFQINLNRMRLLPPETGLNYEGEKAIAKRMHTDFECFKAIHGWTDFTGMIEHGIRKRITPEGIRYILVDEAQDMCQLLYEYHKVLYAENPQAEVTWYGDEDQCIYEFMGADPSIFVQQAAAETVFGETSHRLPLAVSTLANAYISKNKNRLPKNITGQDKPGDVLRATGKEETAREVSRTSTGHVLWLCPTNAQVNRTKTWLLSEGYPLKLTLEEKQAVDALKFILSKPKRLKQADLRLLTESTLDGKKLLPFTKEWWPEPHKMSKQVKAWIAGTDDIGVTGLTVEDSRLSPRFQALLASGSIDDLFIHSPDRLTLAKSCVEASDQPYWIEVTTYHKSKGREADTVVVLKDVAGKMLSSILWDPEAGRRAGFVAMTRTKHRLIMYRDDYDRCRDWYGVTQ